MLNGKSILVTGGTGSFGKKFVATILSKYPDVERLVIYSRDELKQFEMSQIHPPEKYPQIRFFLGDVRDRERLSRAVQGIDIIIHAAALKQVPACEYNPFEAIKTNILGAQNVIETAIDNGVHKVIAISTDKAAAPINLYGATKLCSDKLFIAANNFRGKKDISFSVVRYGNVLGSRGSVVPYFMAKREGGVIPITDARMTRFNITLDEAVDLVLYALNNMWGGEIFVPKIPSYRILDLAEAIAPGCRTEVTGIRPGEKLHEEMITATDSLNTVELPNLFVMLPSGNVSRLNSYVTTFSGVQCKYGFSYNSGDNTEWLTVEEIRDMVTRHVDPTFSVN